MAKDIVLRTRKFINNRLLNRKQCVSTFSITFLCFWQTLIAASGCLPS